MELYNYEVPIYKDVFSDCQVPNLKGSGTKSQEFFTHIIKFLKTNFYNKIIFQENHSFHLKFYYT
jgi:hypothetical protein